jgi:hypothetical protein
MCSCMCVREVCVRCACAEQSWMEETRAHTRTRTRTHEVCTEQSWRRAGCVCVCAHTHAHTQIGGGRMDGLRASCPKGAWHVDSWRFQ